MSGHKRTSDGGKGATRDFLRLPKRPHADHLLISSSPRARKKVGGPLTTPAPKRLNTGGGPDLSGSKTGNSTVSVSPSHRPDSLNEENYSQKRIEELASPQLRRKHEAGEAELAEVPAANARQGDPVDDSTVAGERLGAAQIPAPSSEPDLPSKIPIPTPPTPLGEAREATPEVGDPKHKGVLKSLLSSVSHLLKNSKGSSEDSRPPSKSGTPALPPAKPGRVAGQPQAKEKLAPSRSRSKSPEQWEKVPEDDSTPAVLDPQKKILYTEASPPGGADAVSPCEQAVRSKPAASDGASSTDGESETCLNSRPAGPISREAKPGSESESESETGEETCAAELAAVEVNEEEDGDNDMYEFAFDPYSFIKSLPPLEKCVPAWRRALLPKQTRNCKRKTLVLDLDETLVHSTLDFGEGKTDFTFEVSLNNKKHCVNVRQRPHMAQFLGRCAELFELVIFTASQKLYAEQLLNIIDPGRKLIRHRIYRDSCLFVEGNYLKDLTLLGRDLAHTLIIDNSPQAFGFQLANGVPIESWYDDDTDDELLRMLPFLESLVDVPDVRPYIINAFKLHALVDQAPGYSWS